MSVAAIGRRITSPSEAYGRGILHSAAGLGALVCDNSHIAWCASWSWGALDRGEQVTGLASQAVTAATPAVLGAATTIYEKTEKFRTESAEKLEKYIASTESPPAPAKNPSGVVLGEATTASGVSGFEAPKKAGLVSQVSKASAQIALFITKSKFFFYPLLLLLILFVISMLFKWASRRPV